MSYRPPARLPTFSGGRDGGYGAGRGREGGARIGYVIMTGMKVFARASDRTLTLTSAMILAGRGRTGGWNAKQLACIGIKWGETYVKGWIGRAAGRTVTVANYDRFLSLRNTAVPDHTDNGPYDPPETKPSGWTDEVWELHQRIRARVECRAASTSGNR